jgi:PAS domain S-box-containing protein
MIEVKYFPISFLEDLLNKIEDDSYKLLQMEEIKHNLKKLLDEFKVAKKFDFREIGDHLYDGIYITDGTGKTIYVNKAYERITGIRAEEVVGKNVKDLMEEGLFKNAVSLEVIKHKKQVNSVGISLRNGTKMLVTGNPVLDENGNVKMVVVNDRDITDLLEIKADLETSQMKLKTVEEHERKRRQEIEHLRKLNFNKNLIGQSIEIKNIIKLIHQVANVDATVLITGETGVGKEVVADEIYLNSHRKNEAFIKVNCAAIPANLLEAELFGYERGAFTGANNQGKVGLFELANKGTILLDEIGEMPLDLQTKLLRVIQHKEVTRIGGTKTIKLDVRFLAATNRDLKDMVNQRKFREDLYYRLNVFPIYIPPLRSRIEDIGVLTEFFLDIYNKKYGKQVRLDSSAMNLLKQYPWPGNVRELQSIIERITIISEYDAILNEEQIATLLNIDFYNISDLINKEIGLAQIVENVERKTIEKVLAKYGSTRKAAQVLKIDQSTIVKKAKKLGINIKR